MKSNNSSVEQLTKGLLGHRPADDMSRSMRAARSRLRRDSRVPSRSEQHKADKVAAGVQALHALGERAADRAADRRGKTRRGKKGAGLRALDESVAAHRKRAAERAEAHDQREREREFRAKQRRESEST